MFWIFYNHFIVILYHFLVLTYDIVPSASCCFLHVFYIAGNQYQTESKCNETSRRIFMDQKTSNGPRLRLGVLRGEHNCAHLGCPPDRLFAL